MANSRGIEPDTVVAVGNVDFLKVNRTKTRVGVPYIIQDAFQGAAKLHRLDRGHGDGGIIEAIERQVHEDAGTPITLGQNAHGGHFNIREATAWDSAEGLNNTIREHQPETFVDKVKQLGAQELQMVVTGLVGATGHPLVEGGLAPGFTGQNGRSAFFAQPSQEVGGRVRPKVLEIDLDVATPANVAEELSPAFPGQSHYMLLNFLT